MRFQFKKSVGWPAKSILITAWIALLFFGLAIDFLFCVEIVTYTRAILIQGFVWLILVTVTILTHSLCTSSQVRERRDRCRYSRKSFPGKG